MRFEIKGNKEEIKKHLDKFIEMAKEEYETQKKKVKNFPFQLPEFETGYLEEREAIILWNTFPVPKMFKFVMKPFIKKMEENLKKYFEACNIKVEVKFLGE